MTRPDLTQDRRLTDPRFSRRRFLKLGTLLAVGLVMPQPLYAIPRPEEKEERVLRLFNTHTQERLDVCYARSGKIDRDAIQAVNSILRDHRTDEIHPIDLRLMDLLHAIRLQAGGDSCLHIISGYRSPVTNAKLRRRSRGVAKKSLHMRGHAADIRIPQIGTARLRDIALGLARGGVGFYPKSDFVHVDIGRVRSW
ncbi:MAG TPA: DUF882 domain-containing protein [Desulfosarcina sp.]|nr:DUF882 domain-containing protein [Desulfosarcina sp.]